MSDGSVNARHTAPSSTGHNTGPEQHQWTTARGARVQVINHSPSARGFSGDSVSIYDWNEKAWKQVQKGDEPASLAKVLGGFSDQRITLPSTVGSASTGLNAQKDSFAASVEVNKGRAVWNGAPVAADGKPLVAQGRQLLSAIHGAYEASHHTSEDLLVIVPAWVSKPDLQSMGYGDKDILAASLEVLPQGSDWIVVPFMAEGDILSGLLYSTTLPDGRKLRIITFAGTSRLSGLGGSNRSIAGSADPKIIMDRMSSHYSRIGSMQGPIGRWAGVVTSNGGHGAVALSGVRSATSDKPSANDLCFDTLLLPAIGRFQGQQAVVAQLRSLRTVLLRATTPCPESPARPVIIADEHHLPTVDALDRLRLNYTWSDRNSRSVIGSNDISDIIRMDGLYDRTLGSGHHHSGIHGINQHCPLLLARADSISKDVIEGVTEGTINGDRLDRLARRLFLGALGRMENAVDTSDWNDFDSRIKYADVVVMVPREWGIRFDQAEAIERAFGNSFEAILHEYGHSKSDKLVRVTVALEDDRTTLHGSARILVLAATSIQASIDSFVDVKKYRSHHLGAVVEKENGVKRPSHAHLFSRFLQEEIEGAIRLGRIDPVWASHAEDLRSAKQYFDSKKSSCSTTGGFGGTWSRKKNNGRRIRS